MRTVKFWKTRAERATVTEQDEATKTGDNASRIGEQREAWSRPTVAPLGALVEDTLGSGEGTVDGETGS